MKEAAGEANLTVVAIVLIGIIAIAITPFIRGMVQNTKNRACCNEVGGTYNGSCSITNTAYTTCIAQ